MPQATTTRTITNVWEVPPQDGSEMKWRSL